MIGKLLTASDGSIPILQIVIGVIIGAIAMFVYVKFWKPKILFDTEPLSPDVPTGEFRGRKGLVRDAEGNIREVDTKESQQKQIPISTVAEGISTPSFIDLRHVTTIPMPKLPTVYEQEDEYSNTEDPSDEELSENDEQEPQLMIGNRG